MTVYKAVHSGDVWAVCRLGDTRPELVATTTRLGPYDLDEVFAWMTEIIGLPAEQLHYVGANRDEHGEGDCLYVGTDEPEFVATVAEELR